MNKRSYSRIPRKGLLLAFLIFGLVLLGASNSRHASATTCMEASYDYYAADVAYDAARISWFYDDPVSCADLCANLTGPAHTQCINDCEMDRLTALAAARVNLFAKSLGTCTPITVDECAQARAMAEGCYSQYPYLDYSNFDERLAVYDQYSGCRLASKVDSCQ